MNNTGKNIEPTIELPEHLYHYTSQKGLLGILQNHKLRMTNIFYMNDSNEFSHPMGLFQQEWDKYVNETLEKMNSLESFKEEPMTLGDISKNVKNFHDRIFNELCQSIGMEIFVFSFSGKGDDLSQWRGYCPNTGGFCIEFDKEKLFDIVDKHKRYRIGVCSYTHKEKIKLIDNIIDKYKNSIENWLLQKDKKNTRKMFNEMMNVIPFLKDNSFIDEDEYRICYNSEGENTKFIEGNSMIKPYYESELKGDDGKLPISKIIVGPTPHPELSKLSVKSLLKSEKYKGIEVEKSKIPYRSW